MAYESNLTQPLKTLRNYTLYRSHEARGLQRGIGLHTAASKAPRAQASRAVKQPLHGFRKFCRAHRSDQSNGQLFRRRQFWEALIGAARTAEPHRWRTHAPRQPDFTPSFHGAARTSESPFRACPHSAEGQREHLLDGLDDRSWNIAGRAGRAGRPRGAGMPRALQIGTKLEEDRRRCRLGFLPLMQRTHGDVYPHLACLRSCHTDLKCA